jgi:hypothetical protein
VKLTVYAIVQANGEIRRRRGGAGNLNIYTRKSIAQNHAREDGDSVVECEIDLSKPPLFIRGRKVVADGDS